MIAAKSLQEAVYGQILEALQAELAELRSEV